MKAVEIKTENTQKLAQESFDEFSQKMFQIQLNGAELASLLVLVSKTSNTGLGAFLENFWDDNHELVFNEPFYEPLHLSTDCSFRNINW